jgi:hypothetical protein
MPEPKSRKREIWVTCNQCGCHKLLGKACLDCVAFRALTEDYENLSEPGRGRRRVKHDPL